jgi:hypothetical protein
MQYAILDSTKTVVNVIEWDGESDWTPPAEHIAVPLLEGGIGWTFTDGSFVAPEMPEAVE